MIKGHGIRSMAVTLNKTSKACLVLFILSVFRKGKKKKSCMRILYKNKS